MLYRRAVFDLIEARPWDPTANMQGVLNSYANIGGAGGTPEQGDMIAHDPKDSSKQWLISRADFEAHWVPFDGNNPTGAADQTKIGIAGAATSGAANTASGTTGGASSGQAKPAPGPGGPGGATSSADLKAGEAK